MLPVMLNGKGEIIMPLHIGVIGYNRRIVNAAIQIMIKQTNEEIRARHGFGHIVITTNDITYRNITGLDDNQISGLCFDQVIIVDDERWNVLHNQREIIEASVYRLRHSCVPEDYQIQKLEI